jgi:hypothetical protein
MIKTVLRKVGGTATADTSSNPVDENAADRLAAELGVGGATIDISPEGSETSAAPAQQGNTLSLATTTAVVHTSPYSGVSDGGIEGEFDSNDFRLPQLKIVNGSGKLSQEYNQGTLLYADEQLWGPPDIKEPKNNPTMHLVPVKVVKQWRQNLTQDEVEGGMMPQVVATKEQAEALGGSTVWINNEKPRWAPSAKIIFLLEEPKDCNHPGFSTVLDGTNWAPAVYYSSGTAYNESAKAIFNASQMSLKEAGRIVLHKKIWTMQVVKKPAGKFFVFVPSLKLLREETGPELREFVSAMNGSQSVAVTVVD